MDEEEDMPDKSASIPDTPEEHRARMRHDWSNLIEDLIEEGRQQGAFDELPGRGKPLKLNQNPYGREMELAANLLKNNDLKPAWITNRTQLLEQIASLRDDMKQSRMRHDRAYRYGGEARRGSLRMSWDDACLSWEARIAELNKRIDSFNLKRPSNNLEIFKLRMEEELKRAGAQRWLV